MPTITGTNGSDEIEPLDKTVAYLMYGLGSADNLIAGNLADTIYGGDGDDYVEGHGGADVIYGEAGEDMLVGDAGNDILYGGDGQNFLFGEAGNDTIYSTNSADWLFGGDGADTISGMGVWIEAGEGNDIVHSSFGGGNIYGGGGADTISSVGRSEIFGDDGNDRIYQTGVGNTANGGAGADTFYISASSGESAGGAGNDIYIVSVISDHRSVELADEGYDVVRSTVSYRLQNHFEALQLEGTGDITGYGNQTANNIQGNAGDNLLSGGAGVDTLNGGDGDDVVLGGLNNDLLRGGSGADVFRVEDESLGSATLETDTVYDFSTAEGDIVDLSEIISGDADGAFSLVSAFSKTAGEMTLTFASGVTILRLDNDGDGRVDYQMKINGDVTGDSAGWLL